MDYILSLNHWGLGFVGLFIVAWFVQLYYFLNFFMRVARKEPSEDLGKTRPVSVVICARNEEKKLMDHIPMIMEQDHPDFELVVVNDSSWDDTEAILKALSVSYPNMHVINLDEEKQNMQGKKFALTLGIKAAKYDTILLTDADCRPVSEDWIRRMTGPIDHDRQIVLGFSPLTEYPGWLNKVIRFDTLMIGLQYLGAALAGNPYMGVGRNLCYSREVFFKVGGFRSHYSLTSGDDDLFINQVAGKRNTTVRLHPHSHTVSEPKKTWNEWFVQKRRHFTTAPFYKLAHRIMLVVWPLSFLLLMVGFAGAMVLKTAMLVVGALLLIRYIIQLLILHKTSVKLNQGKDIVWLSPFLELKLYALNAGLYFTNLVRKPQKWN
ncbi:MAG: glycosyltransferase [Crocinitomicaceae bacterium]|nr:glycosyltransferase [Crocinitomicaceae bacterium]